MLLKNSYAKFDVQNILLGQNFNDFIFRTVFGLNKTKKYRNTAFYKRKLLHGTV